MSKSNKYTVKLKRKKQGKTNYSKRIGYLKSGKARIIIRPSSSNMLIQAVSFKEQGDHVIFSLTASELRKIGWKYHLGNIPSSYLAGLYFGIKIKEKIKEAIVDIGFKSLTKGDRLSATIKGIVDSGLKIPYSDKTFPSEERISGLDIVNYAKELSSDKERYETQFSKYLKSGIKPENIQQDFKKTKETILGKK